MGIFNKLFGKSKTKTNKREFDNEVLISLLEKYGQNPTHDNYKQVIDEIFNGNSFLVLPSINDERKPNENWDILQEGATLKLTSVFDQDGLVVLGAFTSPEKLLEWTKRKTQYTSMGSKDVIEFCESQGIDRIVIDSLMDTMFVIERNRDNIKSETIQEDTEVRIGTPSNPISGQLLKKFQSNFSKVSVIKEVYHFLMTRNNENILILGFVLDTYSENSRLACINSVQNSMAGVELNLPLEIFMLDDEDWQNTVKNLQDTLIYRK